MEAFQRFQYLIELNKSINSRKASSNRLGTRLIQGTQLAADDEQALAFARTRDAILHIDRSQDKKGDEEKKG